MKTYFVKFSYTLDGGHRQVNDVVSIDMVGKSGGEIKTIIWDQHHHRKGYPSDFVIDFMMVIE